MVIPLEIEDKIKSNCFYYNVTDSIDAGQAQWLWWATDCIARILNLQKEEVLQVPERRSLNTECGLCPDVEGGAPTGLTNHNACTGRPAYD
jgi:hypothetical protein